ncbi:hypothetical protein AYK25_01615 [Thermoplasmatales archaeon SM1-50]|nr:MAG: hypothetical protein AYK25_01615 [Thermoplasmatales archaeon SM1-50]
MYTLEGIEVTSFHVLDQDSLEQGRAGFITTTIESRYGSLFQEVIANVASCFFLALILMFFLAKPFKRFTVHQFELMGVKRNFNPVIKQ